jgi:hypothetical protein
VRTGIIIKGVYVLIKNNMISILFPNNICIVLFTILFMLLGSAKIYSLDFSADTVGAFGIDEESKWPGTTALHNNTADAIVFDSIQIKIIDCKRSPEALSAFVFGFVVDAGDVICFDLNKTSDSIYVPPDKYPPSSLTPLSIEPYGSIDLTYLGFGDACLSSLSIDFFTEFTILFTLFSSEGERVSLIIVSPYKTSLQPSFNLCPFYIKEPSSQTINFYDILGRQLSSKRQLNFNGIIISNLSDKRIVQKHNNIGSMK